MSTKKQHPYSQRPIEGHDLGYPYERLSWSKKKSGDFKWVEKVADFYDYFYGDYRNNDYVDKLQTNYNLFAGRGEEAMKSYQREYAAELQLEGLKGGYDDIQHYPVINQIARGMVGEQQRRPLSAVAVDSSKYNMNIRKMKRNQLLQSHIDQTILQPINQEAFRIVMEKVGMDDPYAMSPEQQQEFQSMLQKQIQSMTPDEIENYMRKDYKSPSETQSQRILDFLVQDLNVKWLTDESFKHFVIAGKEVVRIYKAHGKVKMDVINPMGFDYSTSPNTHFIEDGEWAKYEEYIKYPDIFNRLGDQLGTKELKKLESEFTAFAQGNGSFGPGGFTSAQGMDTQLDAHFVAAVAAHDRDGTIFNNAPDIRTKDGQNFMQKLYSKFGSSHNGFNTVRHVHIAFKALRKFKYVTRTEKTGPVGYWLDESYQFNPDRGDKKEEIVWIPQVWECDKFGTVDGLYVNKRPTPDQYKSIDNPWDVKLPYIGIEFNRMFENSKPVAPIDFGKPWQYLINVELAKIQELNATDLGKVLQTTLGGIPKDWSPGKFFAMMKYGKVAWVDTQQEGFNPGIDSQIMKSLDLGNTPEMLGRVGYLQFLFGQLGQSMSYTANRQGQTEQYAAVRNAQQDIIQSSYQTEDIYNTHNMFLENVLNALVRCGVSAFRENQKMATYILDDMSVAELNVDWTIMDKAELGVKIRNSSEDFARVQKIKSMSQEMIQNGMMTMPDAVKLEYANNGADILNVAEFAEKKAEKRRQQEFEQQQQLLQQQGQVAQQMEEMKTMIAMQMAKQEQDASLMQAIRVALINSTDRANQFDINQNMVSDKIEESREEREDDAIEKQKDRDLEEKLADKANALKKMEIQSRPKTTKR